MGDRVWLHHPVAPKGAKPKLHNQWKGPFVVSKIVSDVNYRLELPSGSRVHGVVHANRLRTFIDRAKWPEKLEVDRHQGKIPRLPGKYEELEQLPGWSKVKIVRIQDERWQSQPDGTRVREYLTTLKDGSGTKDLWVAEWGITAGDPIYDFHRRKRQKRVRYLEDEENGVPVLQTSPCGGASTNSSGGMSRNKSEPRAG